MLIRTLSPSTLDINPLFSYWEIVLLKPPKSIMEILLNLYPLDLLRNFSARLIWRFYFFYSRKPYGQ